MKPLTGRTRRVLERFPYHLEAAAPGKLLANTTAALVRDQDIQAADLQGIRLAHRLFESRELIDLLRIAGLHGIKRTEMAIAFLRFTTARERFAQLKSHIADNGDPEPGEQLANHLLALWPMAGESALMAFIDKDDDADNPDIKQLADRLLQTAPRALATTTLLDALRQRVAVTSAIHQVGNGTASALIHGAANCLDLDPGRIVHSEDRFWHAATVTDRISLFRPLPGTDKVTPIAPEPEFLGIEENPQRVAEFGPGPVRHTERFHLLRKGFEDALLEIRVRGSGKRTVNPMLVNRDSGHGVGIFSAIPEGIEVVFTQGGRVVMDGRDVTSRCYSWQGACFAEQAAEQIDGEQSSIRSKDFVFANAAELPAVSDGSSNLGQDERISRFVTVTPEAGLDRQATFPHAGDSLPMPGVGIGKTRFAFFVQHGHFAALRKSMPPLPESLFGDDPFASPNPLVLANRELVTPRYGSAIADAALFSDQRGYGESDTPAAGLHLRWLERQAYKVRLYIPPRFRAFDDANGDTVKEYIKTGIERFRPAGIDVEIQFIDQTWTLNEADLPNAEVSLDNPLSRIRSETVLSGLPEL